VRCRTLAFLVVVAMSRGASAADEIPTPRLDRIDYAHPEKYVALVDSLGKKTTLEKIAGEIKGDTPRAKLGAIGAWIDAHLKYDASSFDHWRDVDKLLADGTFGGCADHAEIFGAIARACGVPTVWVKTLDLDWIAWFRAHPDQPKSWNGHVFVEVNLDGKWRLYDASQKVLYDDYDVRQRILPGHRLAYDKGDDPYALLLSTRWDDWKKQTRTFVMSLDMSLVPVGEGVGAVAGARPAASGTVYVVARTAEWNAFARRFKQLGSPISGGDAEFGKWLPKSRGGVLIVVSVAGEMILPDEYRPLLPADADKVRDVLKTKASDVLRKKADDGTDVVMLVARDAAAMRAAIDAFALDPPK
jgi:hypothetical protein